MLKALIAAVVCIVAMQTAALEISNDFRSPRNPERALRKSTTLIVLHTTEAPAKSSLNKVSDRGECHFCVTETGKIYCIVDQNRIAYHAGLSMWKGKEDVDNFSVGVECVGHHNQPMSTVQLKAIAALVADLKKTYKLTDESVVVHSQVAYGSPNKWQKRKHRGRKRCGMLFATATVRRLLGLKARTTVDADVKAGRLIVADAYLNRVLYGGLDIMARYYPAKKAPAKTTPATSTPAKSAPKPTAAALPEPKSVAELTARGFKIQGNVTAARSASKIVGEKWNAADTYYTIRDNVIPGTKIDPAHIETGTCVWRKP